MKPPHDDRRGRGGPSHGTSGTKAGGQGGDAGRASRFGAPHGARGDRPFRPDASRTDRPQAERAGGAAVVRQSADPGRTTLKAPGFVAQPDKRDQQRGAPRGRDPRSGHEPRRNPPATGIDAPRGAVWLYGLHAVAAALANPARRLRRLVLTEEAEQAIAGKLRQPWAVSPERTDRARLDQLLGRDVVHQGAALLADPLALPALAQVLERPGPLLVLDQVNDPRNVGAILRSAAAFGTAAVIAQDRNAPEETGALAKAASGALEIVPLLRAVNIARTLIALKAAGCWVVGLDAAGPPLIGTTLAERRVALVLGSEGDGMRRLTRDTCDEIVGIATPGRAAIESLNVSAAAAIALYELARRP